MHDVWLDVAPLLWGTSPCMIYMYAYIHKYTRGLDASLTWATANVWYVWYVYKCIHTLKTHPLLKRQNMYDFMHTYLYACTQTHIHPRDANCFRMPHQVRRHACTCMHMCVCVCVCIMFTHTYIHTLLQNVKTIDDTRISCSHSRHEFSRNAKLYRRCF
jgi:hypothetical protein